MGSNQSSSSTSSAGNSSSVVKTDCPFCAEKKKDNYRISVYFDGTRNNKYNTFIRETVEGEYESGSSYVNDYSNIARLEMNFIEHFKQDDAHHSFRIYVEGVGTQINKSDTSRAAGTGMFSTGIDDKSSIAMNELKSQIISQMTHESIGYIHIDLFGFSRGAATARYFIHLLLNEKNKTLSDQLKKDGFPPDSVVVKFVGLYDTVASYGLGDWDNDTDQLKLDAVQYAETVVQLAAAEEFRANFRLTNIESARNMGKGTEIFLPGAHSDVGGGYVDGDAETNWRVFYTSPSSDQAISRDEAWLTTRGWYKGPNGNDKGELEKVSIKSSGIYSPYGSTYIPSMSYINATRSNISNNYSFIALYMMSDYAKKSGSLHYDRFIKWKYPLSSDMKTLKSTIEERINNGSALSASVWIDDASVWMQSIRHKYFHFSARYGETMNSHDPQWSEEGCNSGKRQRKVQYG